MNEQQYRVIADRDKGDDPQWGEVESGDRVWFSGPYDDVDRIERPVPTTDEPKRTYTASDVQEAFERGVRRGEEDANERNHSRRQHDQMNTPHPPTRKQIAEAFQQVAATYAPGRTWDTEVMYEDPTWDAMVEFRALIQNKADR